MKIGIQTWGSEGDVRPLLALSAGLSRAGHQVTLAATQLDNRDVTPLGKAFGVAVRLVGRTDPAVLREAGRKLITVTDPLKQLRIIADELFDPLAGEMLEAATELCRENDLVIGHFLVHPLQAAAEKARVPHAAVFLAPMLPSRNVPPPGLPDLGAFLNGLLWKLGDAIIDRMFLSSIMAVRNEIGLPRPGSMVRDVYRAKELNLVGVSPALFPRPADWPDNIRVCGAFMLPDGGEQGELPRDLVRFLDAGPRPVYLTFGSMFIADPYAADTVSLLADAARTAGCRAIIQCRPEEAAGLASSEDLFVISGPAPHDLIFPRCAVVVHHCGAGTTHAASRAGCPSVAVPHATDQAFWAGLLHRKGLAPRPIDRRKATAGRLAEAVRSALASEEMQERARETGEAMRREDGVKAAVRIIEERYSR